MVFFAIFYGGVCRECQTAPWGVSDDAKDSRSVAKYFLRHGDIFAIFYGGMCRK